MIEHLQGTIDSLRRELNEQNARVIEERQGREAIRKRCENTESQLEGLRHQNETLNAIIGRKERRVKELERDNETYTQRMAELENNQVEFIKSKNKYNDVLKRVNEDKERAETAYNAVVEGSRSVKAAYEHKFAEISKHLNRLTEDRQNDLDRIAQLQRIVDEQKKSREQMASIKAQIETEHGEHVRQIAVLVDSFQTKLAKNERETDEKVRETIQLVNELEKTHSLLMKS